MPLPTASPAFVDRAITTAFALLGLALTASIYFPLRENESLEVQWIAGGLRPEVVRRRGDRREDRLRVARCSELRIRG